MDILTAKAIPLDELLLTIGCHPTKQQGGRKWYRSPFRLETTASFVLSKDNRAWFDHGIGEGGNIIDLAMRLGSCHEVTQALAYLQELTPHQLYPNPLAPLSQPLPLQPPAYTLLEAKPFRVWQQRNLTPAAHYLKTQRGIEPQCLAPYLQEVAYRATGGQTQFGFGIPNRSQGYEIRRAGDWAKSSVGPKDVSVFIAHSPYAPWHTFYSLMDFGTFLSVDQPPMGAYNYLIVNGDGLAHKAVAYLDTLPQGGSMAHYPHQDVSGSGQKVYQTLVDFTAGKDWHNQNMASKYGGFKDWTAKREIELALAQQPAGVSGISSLRQTPNLRE